MEKDVIREANRKLGKMEERILKSLSVFLAVIFLTSVSIAQSTTLRGQIVDELGAVIPNAEITLIGNDGKQRTTKSNHNGDFSIPNVAPGIYTLTSAFKGFQTHVESDLKLPVSNGPLTITMTVAVVNVVTDVAANNTTVSTEPDQNMNATVLDEDFIKNLPDNEDELRDFLQSLAGPAAGGGQGGQGGAQFYVDGFTSNRLPPRDSIQQVRINQNPFSAEFERPGFSRIEIITKPGNDQWRGAFGFSARNSVLDARNAFATVRPDSSLERYSFNFGGPLIKKKMSFSIFGDRNGADGAGNTFATTLEGPFYANVPFINNRLFIGSRFDYLINNRNTINVFYNYSSSESENTEFASLAGGGFGGFGGGGFGGGGFGGGGFGGGGFGGGGSNYLLPERGSNRKETEHTLRLSETFIINSRAIHEARLELDYEKSGQIANTPGVAINVLDSFSGGGSPCCPNTNRAFELEFQDYLTLTLKKHTIKGGFQFEYEKVRDISGNNFNGTYTFSSLEQYSRALANIGTATQFTINLGNPLIRYDIYQAGWFIQDDIRINQGLTLSLGLRHEFQSRLQDKNNFAPRIGIAWSPFKSRKTTIRAGGGIFYSRLTGGLYQNTLRYDGLTQQSIIIHNPIFNPSDPLGGNPVFSVQSTIIRTLDPALNAPYSLNFNISVEQQLPKNLIGTLTYINTRGIHQFRSRNINAPDPFLDNQRPDPAKGNIYQVESSARSQYHGFIFGLNRRFGGRFMFFSNYSLSWTRSDADGPTATPANNFDLRAEWGPAFTDRRHFGFVGGSINLPYQFRLFSFVRVGSGTPFNITTGRDDNRDTVINDRPAGINRNSDLPASLYPLIPNACIRDCQPGGTPILLRDYLLQYYPNGVSAINPGFVSVNTNISKTFGFGKRNGGQLAQGGPGGGGPGGGRGGRGGGGGGGPRMIGMGGGGQMGGPFGGGSESSRYNITISAQISNLFNRVNLGQYSGVLTSPLFGQSSSAQSARQIELSVRFNF
jgi:hypothetical protein